jgi:Fe-S-cluster containining protein
MNETLIFPENTYYTCTGHGRCCRGWDIHVDPVSYGKIIKTDSYKNLLNDLGQDPIPIDDEKKTVIALRRANGDCIFLNSETLCALQVEAGYHTKPLGCRQFPFTSNSTPDGIFIGISFYCQSCQLNEGRPISTYSESIESCLRESHGAGLSHDIVALERDVFITWKGYLILERFIISWLSRFTNKEEALWNALVGICLLVLRLRREKLQNVTPEEIEEALEKVASIRVPKDALFEQLGLFFTMAIIGSLESGKPEDAQSNTKAAMDGGILKSGLFAKDISMAPFPAYYRDNPSPWKLAHIGRYVDHLMFQKFLVGTEPLLNNLIALYTACNLIDYYFYFSAFQEGSQSPVLKDIHIAYGIVEKFFAGHTRGLEPFFSAFAEGFINQLGMKMGTAY